MAGTIEGQGLVARVTTALRYAITGTAPGNWFGPLDPLPPQAPEDVRGRQFDYPIGFNINQRPRATEPLSFDQLKKLATYPLIAMLIQRQKDKIAALEWQIKPRAEEDASLADDPAIGQITDMLRFPDKEHDWVQWIGAVLDQYFIIDAVTIYAAPTRDGGVYALQQLDGATIKPILSYGGRRPLAPAPAYQQTLKGLPAVDYTADELIYFPGNVRADRIYGYSRVEQARDLIEMAISRLKSQKGYFDFGNLGDGYFTMPEGWTPEQTLAFEMRWNAAMDGSDIGIRRRNQFAPSGIEWHATKADLLEDSFDEMMIRLLCFPFGVAPQPFMKQTGLGHGSAGTEHEAAEEGGLSPLMNYISRLMSMIIAKWFARPDLEFSFVEDREFDPKTAAEIDDIRLKNGTRTINEVRDRNGEKPLPDGDKPLLNGTGWSRLEDAVKEPAPLPAMAPPVPGAVDGGAATETPPAPAAEADKTLAKAADPALQRRLTIILTSYLTDKAVEIATVLSEKLGVAEKANDPSSEDYTGRIEEAYTAYDWDWRDLPPLVEPTLAGIAVTAGANAVSTLGLFDAETLTRISARSTAYAEARGAELVGMKWVDGELIANPDATWSITETTRNYLRTAIRDAMAEGQSTAQLRKTIEASTAFSKERADMISRTETAVADVRGEAAAWIESGVVSSARFDASPDCCDECQAQDGTIVELSEPEDLDLPHPNCRCSWSAVVDDTPIETGE